MAKLRSVKAVEVAPGVVEITCSACGQRITHSNQYGMYCDKECGIEEDRANEALALNLIKTFMQALGMKDEGDES